MNEVIEIVQETQVPIDVTPIECPPVEMPAEPVSDDVQELKAAKAAYAAAKTAEEAAASVLAQLEAIRLVQWFGTRAEYAALVASGSINANTMYYVYDTDEATSTGYSMSEDGTKLTLEGTELSDDGTTLTIPADLATLSEDGTKLIFK